MNNTDMKETKVVLTCCGIDSGKWMMFWGILLILLGALGLLSTLWPTQHLGQFLLPGFLLLWGGMLLFSPRR